MKQISLLVLCAMMATIMIGCKNKETVTNPGNNQTVLPCAVYVGDELDPYTTPESLQADCMGDNQLRIIWLRKDQCDPKFDINATLINHTITLTCQDTAYMVASCECLFPLYFDFDSLAYGTYSVIAGGVTHEIDFQRDMQPYRYEATSTSK